METLSVEVAVVGAGTAGMVAYRAAKMGGKRVVLIEGGAYGTTCARVGCMPSKLLIAAAEAAHQARRAAEFGVNVEAVRVDGKAVMARVRTERDRLVGYVLDDINRMPQADRIAGHARFIAPQRLQVDDRLIINAQRIVLATGSVPQVPAILQGLGDRLLTSDAVFDWDDLPESVAVVGTGVIGLEIGQALHRLGVRVGLFGRSERLAQLSDPQVLAQAVNCFSNEFALHLHAEIVGADKDKEGVTLRYRTKDGAEHTEKYAYVLAATGRAPDLRQLALKCSGLVLNEAGVPLYDPRTMQCGEAPVFIAGDANAAAPILHEATDEGRIAGNNATSYPDVKVHPRFAPFSVAFTDPQILTVGRTHGALEAGRYVIGEVSFENQGRSRVMLQNHGMLRIYADSATGKLIGAEMCGPRAEHLGHVLAWSCQQGMTVAAMLSLPFYHPTIEEGLRTALKDAKRKLKSGLTPSEACTDCVPGA